MFQKRPHRRHAVYFANTPLFMGISGTAFQLSWAYNSISRAFPQQHEPSGAGNARVEPEIVDRPGARDLPLRKSKIVFDRVSFGYNGKNPLFRNLKREKSAPARKWDWSACQVPANRTLSSWISRYYDVTGGAVSHQRPRYPRGDAKFAAPQHCGDSARRMPV